MLDYIKDNWLELLITLYTAATLIALLTPSDKDNTVMDKIGQVADAFGLKLKGKGSAIDLCVSLVKRIIRLVKRA